MRFDSNCQLKMMQAVFDEQFRTAKGRAKKKLIVVVVTDGRRVDEHACAWTKARLLRNRGA